MLSCSNQPCCICVIRSEKGKLTADSWLLSDSVFSLSDCTDLLMQCSILASVVVVIVKHVLILFFATCVSLFTYYQFLMPTESYKKHIPVAIYGDTV